MDTYRPIGLFAYAFGAGWVASLLLVPWKGIARKFFLMNAAFALLMAAIGTALVWRACGPPDRLLWGAGEATAGAFSGTGCILVLVITLLLCSNVIARVCLWLASVASIAGIALAVQKPWPALADASGGIVMGTVLSAMILGHWYLAGPGLSFDLLVRASKVLFGTLVFRLVIALVTLAARHDLGSLAGVSSNDMTKAFNGWLLWIRLVAGLVVPLVFAWMVWQCARIKSNQSATGILYAMIPFVLVGELLALYYQARTGVPV